ncbi:MAG: ribose 5-phosphate isomerase B [Planctomycetota bacterium]|nr:ribose 5-phosphate isomerase B [Planctomycetota bacterium]MDA1163602.1 ribose 5-phosphate isomerase B [Planctomycetota bacterium]
MKIAVASDHRGVSIRARILEIIRSAGYEGIDFGATSQESVDYPDYAAKVAGAISRHEADRGILICGTGIGMCIAANKFDGIRAAPVHDDITAALSRQHNDLNVLCLSADLISEQALDRIIEIWLKTEFEGGRHARRLGKVSQIEAGSYREPVAQDDPVA